MGKIQISGEIIDVETVAFDKDGTLFQAIPFWDEIATSNIEDAPFLRDQVTELKIEAGLQYDKYDDEYIIEF